MRVDPTILGFFGGALTLGFLVAAAFFLKFWRRTRDPLFLSFAAAFTLLAANQAAPVVFNIPREDQAPVYLLRLAGFGLIIWAILRKNLKRS
ncbi:DUF5985 family protein [Phenylobacterium sp.]|uniref:DUF5985 family protein n=1 Tax=Phenylobacterium sp. TaxID=1871053 RepID=UPI002810E1A5|nr:DUF5985 family protein [Phenylobacterium sp.]